MRHIQGFARIAEHEQGNTRFNGFYAGGFYINNVQVPGSVLCAGDLYMMWRPRTMQEVTPESLVLLEVIKPAPEVLVLGCGLEAAPLPPAVRDYLRSLNVAVEVLGSKAATGYFNVLNDEGRVVVGALLALDPTIRLPEVMPKNEAPLWERKYLSQKGDKL